ncbi:hypothetical protein HanRHA438_Chr01g0020751 [Helianthus annuus]|nr:hypothetical protein HanIR_Chr01g0021941 [Helianthus annuus]KAJ0947863.1 hypothetical protein HanRHA438_Chr01g0020751 [Helianthus annuus]
MVVFIFYKTRKTLDGVLNQFYFSKLQIASSFHGECCFFCDVYELYYKYFILHSFYYFISY